MRLRGMIFCGGRGGGGMAEKRVPVVGACMGVWGHVSQENLFHFCVILIAEWGTHPPLPRPPGSAVPTNKLLNECMPV